MERSRKAGPSDAGGGRRLGISAETALQGEGSGIGIVELAFSKGFCVLCISECKALFFLSQHRRFQS